MGVLVLRDAATLDDAGRPHVPRRPLWTCRACELPWPCPAARLALVEEFRLEPLSLFLYLGLALYDAAGDLHALNPNPGVTPAELHARFIGWVRETDLVRRALGARGHGASPATPPPSGRYPSWRAANSGP
ncbi:hypothetical protein [Plantactinospora sp. CA-290183]|uniref:hypothetical protein n=1 Tax=Plantactinospora sp. CA-290183 TaxID=3240006 RepID=UPI003D8BA7C5